MEIFIHDSKATSLIGFLSNSIPKTSNVSYKMFQSKRKVQRSGVKLTHISQNEFDVNGFQGVLLDVTLITELSLTKEEVINYLIEANKEIEIIIFTTLDHGGRILGEKHAHLNYKMIHVNLINNKGTMVTFKIWYDPLSIKELPKFTLPQTIISRSPSPGPSNLDIKLPLVSEINDKYVFEPLRCGINGASGRIGINLFSFLWGNINYNLEKVVVDRKLLNFKSKQQIRLLELWFFDEIFGCIIPGAIKSIIKVKPGMILGSKIIKNIDTELNLFKPFFKEEEFCYILISQDFKVLVQANFKKDGSNVNFYSEENEYSIDVIDQENDPRNIDWGSVEIIFECTGVFRTYDEVSRHLRQNTQLVIICSTIPGWEGDFVIHPLHQVKIDERIVSAGSSVTNAIAGPLYILNNMYKVFGVSFTNLRSITNLQTPLPKQNEHTDASVFSVSLMKTRAVHELRTYFDFNFPIVGCDVRASSPLGSVITANVLLKGNISSTEINNALKKDGMIVMDETINNTSDVIGRHGLQIINPLMTKTESFLVKGQEECTRVSFTVWFDNEGHYAQQLLRIPIVQRLMRAKSHLLSKQRILSELELAGSGKFNDIIVISDIHGAGGKLFILLIYTLNLEEFIKEDIDEIILKLNNGPTKCIERTNFLNSMLRKKFSLISFKNLFKKKMNKMGYEGDNVNEFINEFYNDLKIYFSGDIGDRGPYSVWAFKQLEELQSLKILEIACIGNHDMWLFMNLMAWHLPLSEDYDFHDRYMPKPVFTYLFPNKAHRIELHRSGIIQIENHIVTLLTHDFNKVKKALLNNTVGLTPDIVFKKFGAFTKKEIKEIVSLPRKQEEEEFEGEITKEEKKIWWAKQLHIYNQKCDEFQKRRDIIIKNSIEKVPYSAVRNRVQDLFDKVKVTIEKDSSEDTLWNDLRGVYFGTDVNAGFRAVGRMSLKWWKEHLILIKHYTNNSNEWNELEFYVNRVVEELEVEYNKHLLESDSLIYKVFQAIFYENYISSEWWSLDLSWHPGWGPLFMADETNRIKMIKGEEFNESDIVTGANYFLNENFIKMAQFIRKNFKLFTVTETRDLFLHGLLPIHEYLEDGIIKHTFGFTYRGVFYSGNVLFSGLSLIERDIRSNKNIREAFNLVNSWYADKTTCSKPRNLDKCWPFIKEILKSINIERLYLGHMPFISKVHLRNRGYTMISEIVFTDDGLSSGYNFSGGCRILSLSRSFNKFKRMFSNWKELIKSNQAILHSDGIISYNHKLWDKLPAIGVFGFNNRDSIIPKWDPIITPMLKNGSLITIPDGILVTLKEKVIGKVQSKCTLNLLSNIGVKNVHIIIEKGTKVIINEKIKVISGKNRIRIPIGTPLEFGENLKGISTHIFYISVSEGKMPQIILQNGQIIKLDVGVQYNTKNDRIEHQEYFVGALQVEDSQIKVLK